MRNILLDLIITFFATLGAITFAHKVLTGTLNRFDVYCLALILFTVALSCIAGFLRAVIRLWWKFRETHDT